MSRRRGFAALAAICALAGGGSAASTALAGTTAFTCVPGGGAANTNADCSPGSTGTSGHVAIPTGESTQFEQASLGETEFGFIIGGVNFAFRAAHLECIECHLSNHEEVGGAM